MEILLLEDDIQLNTTLRKFLQYKNYRVSSFLDGEEAMRSIDENIYDLYIIDINLSKMSGLDIAKYIRNKNLNTPIIIITASLEVEYIKIAFGSGCNEYIKKPFHLEELSIRINNIFKQSQYDSISIAPNIMYDTEYEELIIDNDIIKLRKKERRLLGILLQNMNHTVTYEVLENYIWENEVREKYPLRQLVAELKKHFKDKAYLIEANRGLGYRLLEEKV